MPGSWDLNAKWASGFPSSPFNGILEALKYYRKETIDFDQSLFAFHHNSPRPRPLGLPSCTAQALKHDSCQTGVCFVRFSDSSKATLASRTLTPLICHGVCSSNFHHLDIPGAFEKGVQAPEAKTSTRANSALNSTPNIVISTVLCICACWQVALSVTLKPFEYFFILLQTFKLFIQKLVFLFSSKYFFSCACLAWLPV